MRKLTTEEFIKRAINVHGNVYDYSKTEYIGIVAKVSIFCKKHSKSFFQSPNDHFKGYGCHDCGKESSTHSSRITTETFIERAISVHGDKFGYDKVDYKGSKEDIEIFCKLHNAYFTLPAGRHLEGRGYPKTKRAKSTKQFIEDAVNLHGDKYDYSLVEYISAHTKIEILCNIHGSYLQVAYSHLQGQGCAKCGKESHWRRSDYIKKANGRLCIFYTLRCFNEKEEFYKIGITMNNIKKRYSTVKEMPYSYEIISEFYGEAGTIYNLERDEKRKLKSLHYKPILNFGGSETECFTDYKI